jgi:pre-mRNA 3'-end-processing factor FIP1
VEEEDEEGEEDSDEDSDEDDVKLVFTGQAGRTLDLR